VKRLRRTLTLFGMILLAAVLGVTGVLFGQPALPSSARHGCGT
jgi:hypothetical protein